MSNHLSEVADMDDELRPEYDLETLRLRRVGPGVQQQGLFVRVEADVAQVFPNAEAVNEALRFLIRIAHDNKASFGVQPSSQAIS